MNNKESQSLLEVWEWKEKAYHEVADLDIRSALKERIKRSNTTAEKLGYKTKKLKKLAL
jgi:hypothetical protein